MNHNKANNYKFVLEISEQSEKIAPKRLYFFGFDRGSLIFTRNPYKGYCFSDKIAAKIVNQLLFFGKMRVKKVKI